MPTYRNARPNQNVVSNAAKTTNLAGLPKSASENNSSPRRISMISLLKKVSMTRNKLIENNQHVRPANKLRLDMQFDAILKPKKANRQKKRKKDDEEILDRFADEEVSRLREAMLGAAADDEQANRDKLPATNKLKLLPQVMEVLRK
jgi:transcription factor SPN1